MNLVQDTTPSQPPITRTLIVFLILTLSVVSCGKDESTASAGKTTEIPAPTPEPKPWDNVNFVDLPKKGETLTNIRKLEFNDSINVEAQFDEIDGAVEKVCRVQKKENKTYKVCASDTDDDGNWDVICETSTEDTTFEADSNCTVTFAALKDISDTMSAVQAMEDVGEEGFCKVSVNNDEGSVTLTCQDGWNSVAYKGDEDGHASKRICRTNLDGETLTGRCLDIQEEEDTSGETPVIKVQTVKAAKLQSTTWDGFLFKASEVNTRSDGVDITTLYKSGETSVREAILPADIESHPEGSSTLVFNITSGGPGDGDMCSFANSASTCSLGEKMPEDISGTPQTQEALEANRCQIIGDALGTCTVSLTISSDDFVDKRIMREVEVKNLQNATWDGFQDSKENLQAWVKSTETLNPAPLGSPDGTVEQQFALRAFGDDGSPLVSDCEVDSNTGFITASSIDDTGSCYIKMTVTSTGYMTKIFQIPVGVYGDSGASALNSITWPLHPYGENPFHPGNTLAIVSEPTSTASGSPQQTDSRILNIVYKSQDDAVCTVDPTTGVIVAVKNGACVIEAMEMGTQNIPPSLWVAAPALAVTDPTDRTIELNGFQYSAPSMAFGEATPTLTAPTLSLEGVSVAYGVTGTSTGCGVHPSNGELTINGVGTCIVQVTASRASYDNAMATFTLTIEPGAMTLSGMVYSASSVAFGEDAPTLTTAPTASQSGAAITYAAADTSTGCTVETNGTVALTAVGSCIVEATATLVNYNDAKERITITINTGTMDSFDGLAYGTNTFPFNEVPAVTAPISDPTGATVTYALVTGNGINNACTVDPQTGALTPTKTGTCNIIATGALDNYISQNDSVEVNITDGTMTLSGMAYSANSVVFGATAPTLASAPTASQSDATIAYAAGSSSTGCTVSPEGTLTITGVGSCIVEATATKTYYATAKDSVTIEITKAAQSFSWPNNPYGASPALQVGGSALSLQAQMTAGQGTIQYQSQDVSICTVVAAGTITPVGAGTCIIEARYTGNANYEASSWTALAGITVAKGTQTFVWPDNPYGASPSLTVGGSTLALENIPSAGKGVIQYQSQAVSICTVLVDGTITPKGAGSCVILARYASNTNYESSSWTALDGITVGKGTASSFDGLAYGTNTFAFNDVPNVTVPVSDPVGARITYGLVTGDGINNSCSVHAETGALTPIRTGTCTIMATGVFTNYVDENDVVEVTITDGTMTLSGMLYSSNSITYGDTAPTLLKAPTASESSGVTITYATADSSTGCNVNSSDGALNIIGGGTCIAEATATKTNYADATDTFSITVAKATQSAFVWPNNPYGANPTLKVGGSALAVQATMPSGQGAIQYRSQDESICTVVSGGTITPMRAGTCVIEARYAGNASYNESDWVTYSVTVAKGEQVAFVWPNNPYGSSPRVFITGSIALQVTVPTAATTEGAFGAIEYRSRAYRYGSLYGNGGLNFCNVNENGTVSPTPSAYRYGSGCSIRARYGATDNYEASVWIIGPTINVDD